MSNFQQQVAAITGAGSGMGRALAQSLAQQGCHLAIADINQKGLNETVSSIKINTDDPSNVSTGSLLTPLNGHQRLPCRLTDENESGSRHVPLSCWCVGSRRLITMALSDNDDAKMP